MMEVLISPTSNVENKLVKREGAGSTQMISLNQAKASEDDVADDKMENDQNNQLDFNFAKQPNEIIREPQSKISSSSLRSPRCEAFLMTGDKMLNLNPKISPCYAKICQNQLPPAVEIDSYEQHKITPTKKTRLDQFPSMQKNGMHKNKDTSLTGDDANLDLLTENNSTKPNENLKPLIFDESIGANIVPADPSDKRYYQSSSATLQQNNLSEISDMDPISQIVRSSKSAQINRFIASQSQSTPNSPAHLFQQFASQNIDSKLSNRESNDLFSHVQSIYSSETITRLAQHLFVHQESIKIAAFLVKSDELSIRIAREFVSLFNFAGIRVDIALRTFLSHVCLPTGESSERAQLLEHYAHRYHECNPTVFNSADEIHPLTCALLFLNSDLHGKQNGKKMSCRDFIENLSRTDFKYSPALLKELYLAVKEKPFYYKAGEELIKPTSLVSEFGLGREKRSSRIIKKKGSISSTMLINPEHQVDYKHGWLKKKSIYDSDGSMTPLGRRKWTMLYGTVRGMVLYLHENENSFSSGQYFTFRNCILLHHSLAEVARDYIKKKNIFRLRTANLGEFLFQTSDPAEVQKWVDILNYVAAAFSAPALPTPVASNGVITFYRPNLPSTPTHFPMVEQLRAHEQRLEETTTNLAHLRENAPPMKSKGKIVYDYFYKERFLDKERERYKIYTEILREKLARTSSIIRCESQSAANTNF